MPNSGDYYTEQFTGQEHALIKVEQIVASLRAIATGLRKLPGERELLEDRVTAVTATGGPTAYTVTMASPPAAYVDGIALQVRFPQANAPNPTLDLLDESNMSLGAKPIKQVDGTDLSAGHIAANARAELYYVAEGAGYWTLGAGARGVQGPAGPPAGTFSLNADKELVFTPSDGVTPATTLGPATFRWRGAYSGTTEYEFLNVVRSGSKLYLYINATASTGTAVTTATHWQILADFGSDGGVHMEFRTATGDADPGNGRMRFNHATPSSVTEIYIDLQDADGNDITDWIDRWDDYGGNDPHAHLVMKETGEGTSQIIFALNEVATLTGYRRLTVTHVAGDTLFSQDDIVSVTPLLRGNAASLGSDVTAIDVLTQNAYDALTPDANTLYVITG